MLHQLTGWDYRYNNGTIKKNSDVLERDKLKLELVMDSLHMEDAECLASQFKRADFIRRDIE